MGVHGKRNRHLEQPLRLQPREQSGSLLRYLAKLVHPFQSLGDPLIQFLHMIPIISQSGVNLAKAQIGMLQVQLLRAPAIGQPLRGQLDDLL